MTATTLATAAAAASTAAVAWRQRRRRRQWRQRMRQYTMSADTANAHFLCVDGIYGNGERDRAPKHAKRQTRQTPFGSLE